VLNPTSATMFPNPTHTNTCFGQFYTVNHSLWFLHKSGKLWVCWGLILQVLGCKEKGIDKTLPSVLPQQTSGQRTRAVKNSDTWHFSICRVAWKKSDIAKGWLSNSPIFNFVKYQSNSKDIFGDVTLEYHDKNPPTLSPKKAHKQCQQPDQYLFYFWNGPEIGPSWG